MRIARASAVFPLLCVLLCARCTKEKTSPPHVDVQPAASAVSSVDPPRKASVLDAPWAEVSGWIRKGEVCWVAPTAASKAFVTKCGGPDFRTEVPSLEGLSRLIDEVDPAHENLGFTTYYAEHVEIAWPAAAALFATGTVWEVEANQNLRTFIKTIGPEGTPRGHYVTVAESASALERLAAQAKGPMRVKLWFVEEIPWRRAVALIAANEIKSAGSVHVNRAFLESRDGKSYMTIPSPPDSLKSTITKYGVAIPVTIE